MSRSRRRTPRGPIASADSEKQFKRETNQAFRAAERKILKKLHDDPEADVDAHLPKKPHEVVEEWSGPKDGKSYFGDLKRKDPKYFNKLMRK
jgi:hypothetical protein